ncbi:hypothetical protein [Aeromicrobium sp. CF3.5]|uniref:hypothetical protein n=1 Tax=Aeromicrobium sp. CF3.5 TaxID=3373078 RepID=UPI003EE5B7CD
MALMAMDVAAERLSVSVRQVQRLAKAGAIVAVGANLLDAESVHRFGRQRAGHRQRAWAEDTAWAAIGLLAGVRVEWLGQAQRSRLKGRLRDIGADEFVSAVRNRATVHHFAAHRAAATRLGQRLVTASTSPLFDDLTPASGAGVEGYLATDDLDGLIDEFALATDGVGDIDVTVCTTSFDLGIIETIAGAGETLAAIDLATSLDPREHTAALDALTRRLKAFA